VSAEDGDILDMLATHERLASAGGYTEFGLATDEFGGRFGRRLRSGFKAIGSGIATAAKATVNVVKRVADNKIVRIVAKTALTMVPGIGAAVVAGATAARLAAKLIKAAKAGDPDAQAAYELAEAAKAGDTAALATLQEAATGEQATLPLPPKLRKKAEKRAKMQAREDAKALRAKVREATKTRVAARVGKQSDRRAAKVRSRAVARKQRVEKLRSRVAAAKTVAPKAGVARVVMPSGRVHDVALADV
jgi:hypothetical protein